MTKPYLTPRDFDASARNRRDRIVWTAEAIADRIGVSADFVRGTLVNLEGSPVKKIGTRYCAHEGDLLAFFRTQPRQA